MRRLGLASLLVLLLCMVSIWTAHANSSIAQSFASGDSGIVTGALVSLKEGMANTVELTDFGNSGRLIGVVGEQSLLELTNGDPVKVVTSGATATLVTDLNGEIKTGDHITVSPIRGVGMKATESAMVAGTAQQNLDLSKTESRTIKAKDGKTRSVHIGSVLSLIAPAFYEPASSQNTLVPSAFQALANNVAGHAVSAVRVMVAGLLVILLFTVVAMLVYSAVRSSIISIGRNPLSAVAVRKSLFEVGVTTIGILAFTIIIIYLILTT